MHTYQIKDMNTGEVVATATLDVPMNNGMYIIEAVTEPVVSDEAPKD